MNVPSSEVPEKRDEDSDEEERHSLEVAMEQAIDGEGVSPEEMLSQLDD